MKDKKLKSERELLLLLLDSANYEVEYKWVKAQLERLDALDAPPLAEEEQSMSQHSGCSQCSCAIHTYPLKGGAHQE